MQHHIIGTGAIAVGTVPFLTVFGLIAFNKTVFHQGIQIFIGQRPNAAAFTAVAAIGAAARHKFFTAETGRTVAAFAGHHFDFCFVDKFHNVLNRKALRASRFDSAEMGLSVSQIFVFGLIGFASTAVKCLSETVPIRLDYK